MLAPHHAEDAELCEAGGAAEDADDFLVFLRRELVLRDDFGSDGSCCHTAAATWSMDWNTTRLLGRAHERLGGALGVRHHAHYVSFAVEHAGDIAQRAVGIIEIAEGDAVLRFELIESALVGKIAALAMRDGQAQGLAEVRGGGEGRAGGFHAEANFPADEFQAAIAHEGAGKEARFDQNLEAVADAEHQAAFGRETLDRAHDGRKLGDGAAAEIVAIGETAGEDDGIDGTEGGGTVPDELSRLTEIMGETGRLGRIVCGRNCFRERQ